MLLRGVSRNVNPEAGAITKETVSGFGAVLRLYYQKVPQRSMPVLLGEPSSDSHPLLENLAMRVPILCGAAMLSAVLMIGCGADSGPTAENAAGLTPAATSPNTSDHFTT